MKAAPILPLALLAACGQPQSSEIATNTATAATPAPADPVASTPGEIPTPAPSVSPTPLPDVVSEVPFTADSAQGAADIVQTYFALIEAGKYRQAWALWRDGGKASGLDAVAFARSFDQYAAYHATVGAPGPIDAGAGQRYVAVPVKTYGTLKTGKSFAATGTVTLHRTADIDGATAEQQSWHISASTLKLDPVKSGEAVRPPTATAHYTCNGGFAFAVRFDNRADTATLSRGGRMLATLAQQRAASGIWYSGQGYVLRGKGAAATLTRPSGKALDCTAG